MLGMVMQVAERLTALKSACTALEASSTGKASGAKLQKALAKLQKVDNPLVSQPQLAAPTSSPHASAPQAAAAASQLVEPGQGSAAAPAEMKVPPVSSLVLPPGCCSPLGCAWCIPISSTVETFCGHDHSCMEELPWRRHA